MAAGFQVRAATMEDVVGVLRLDGVTELLPHWAESQYVAAVTRVNEGVRRCLFVAETAAELVGFGVGMVAAVGNSGDETLAELESVAVAQQARRMGVGAALCREVIGWARESGAKDIELEVRSRSAGAIQLYVGLGFVAVGRRGGYYKGPEDEAVLMRLQL